MNTDISGADITLATTTISVATVTLTLAAPGEQISAGITSATGSVPSTIAFGGDIISETSPSFSAGSDPSSKNYTESTVSDGISHGYMPYVPPFLDPEAEPYVEITFSPEEDKIYSAKEIIEQSTYEYYNFKSEPSNPNTNTNYKYSMSLSASLNLGMCVTLNTDNESYDMLPDPETGELKETNRSTFTEDPNRKLSRWVIQTKWETPVMDFQDCKVTALNLDSMTLTQSEGSPWKERYWDTYYTSSANMSDETSGNLLTASTGMWHQSGSIIDREGKINSQNQKGYYLVIKDVETDFLPG